MLDAETLTPAQALERAEALRASIAEELQTIAQREATRTTAAQTRAEERQQAEQKLASARARLRDIEDSLLPSARVKARLAEGTPEAESATHNLADLTDARRAAERDRDVAVWELSELNQRHTRAAALFQQEASEDNARRLELESEIPAADSAITEARHAAMRARFEELRSAYETARTAAETAHQAAATAEAEATQRAADLRAFTRGTDAVSDAERRTIPAERSPLDDVLDAFAAYLDALEKHGGRIAPLMANGQPLWMVLSRLSGQPLIGVLDGHNPDTLNTTRKLIDTYRTAVHELR